MLIFCVYVNGFFFCRQNILLKRFFNRSGELSRGQEETGILAGAPNSINWGSELCVGILFFAVFSKEWKMGCFELKYVFILNREILGNWDFMKWGLMWGKKCEFNCIIRIQCDFFKLDNVDYNLNRMQINIWMLISIYFISITVYTKINRLTTGCSVCVVCFCWIQFLKLVKSSVWKIIIFSLFSGWQKGFHHLKTFAQVFPSPKSVSVTSSFWFSWWI